MKSSRKTNLSTKDKYRGTWISTVRCLIRETGLAVVQLHDPNSPYAKMYQMEVPAVASINAVYNALCGERIRLTRVSAAEGNVISAETGDQTPAIVITAAGEAVRDLDHLAESGKYFAVGVHMTKLEYFQGYYRNSQPDNQDSDDQTAEKLANYHRQGRSTRIMGTATFPLVVTGHDSDRKHCRENGLAVTLPRRLNAREAQPTIVYGSTVMRGIADDRGREDCTVVLSATTCMERFANERLQWVDVNCDSTHARQRGVLFRTMASIHACQEVKLRACSGGAMTQQDNRTAARDGRALQVDLDIHLEALNIVA